MNLTMRPALDPRFQPLSVLFRDFSREAARMGGPELRLSIERDAGLTETVSILIFPEGVDDARNRMIAERLAKTLLWAYGGWKLIVSGSRAVYAHLLEAYRVGGAREFDFRFMSDVFERPFQLEYREKAESAPQTRRQTLAVGRHLDGCRIGFDAGGSDRKVSAVIDGKSVYSEEVVWHPKLSANPDYQYRGILDSLRRAAEHLPRVDAIGVSTAGVVIGNRVMNSSLFLKVPKELFDKRCKTIYLDSAREVGENIPVEVANDGDVTALAGAINLKDGRVLGVAMGTSEAGGYVDREGNITGWLNELAFVPVDACPEAMADEWSGDIGCGVKYFSQDAVIKLAPAAGIELNPAATPAEKLQAVQERMAEGDGRARKIYETIGVYFGYAIAYYALFYDIRHVLLMGRVSSGEGGVILLEKAREVLRLEFPELSEKIELSIPDEKSRRVGQSVAAASLPKKSKA